MKILIAQDRIEVLEEEGGDSWDAFPFESLEHYGMGKDLGKSINHHLGSPLDGLRPLLCQKALVNKAMGLVVTRTVMMITPKGGIIRLSLKLGKGRRRGFSGRTYDFPLQLLDSRGDGVHESIYKLKFTFGF
eukprot:Gb_41816 [translate_table: standard]